MIRRQEAARIIIEAGPDLERLLFAENPEAWLDVDLTMVQFKSLVLILSHDNISPSKLARILGVTPANITGVVERLVKVGLVRRTENPDDRRVLLLEVTEKGNSLLARITERNTDDMSHILDLMTSEELSHLAQGLVALVNATRRRRATLEGIASSENMVEMTTE